MEDHSEIVDSNEAEALTRLEACRSLMEKLAQQGYDYVYDPADLALVKQHQEAIAAAAHFSEAAQRAVESRFPGKGFVWLTFYQENMADVERRGAERPSFFNHRLIPPHLRTSRPALFAPSGNACLNISEILRTAWLLVCFAMRMMPNCCMPLNWLPRCLSCSLLRRSS